MKSEKITAPEGKTTDFGYTPVPDAEKAQRVAGVFHSVAPRYDLMNDLMSAGLHRLWKRFCVELSGLKPGNRVLDLAGGTGDLARLYARRVGTGGETWLADINYSMLELGRDRLLDEGLVLPSIQCDGERLPFKSNYFDCVSVGFGLRNMTHKEAALVEMHRVLRPGGRAMVLEFSKVWAPLKAFYDAYSFSVLPLLGKLVTGDAASYRYLAESIRVHPSQEELKAMMAGAGFERVEYFNLSAGVVAIHRGYKL
ncbi:MAG TPA: bifunctional demethylmenaquinone methyltransferase/2-methoxy-6-polyprenyl-1,4-benzoquinol methylase UbiE [Burkholderiales bacterium]|nr:bifunctional demethylmenaquinone methyltransferase/2-methoxy-6-polyprenyl-1,4-benzoquinol methylase UbiE [Burkholderiales bacterium]